MDKKTCHVGNCFEAKTTGNYCEIHQHFNVKTVEYELRIGRNDNSETIIMRGFTAADVLEAARFYSKRPCAVGIYRDSEIVGLARNGSLSVLEEHAPDLASALKEQGREVEEMA